MVASSECVSEDTINTSIAGRKRKISDEVGTLNEVSAPKKVRDEVQHDHPYGVSKSPRRLKRQLDDVTDKAKRLTKKVKSFKQKARRLKRKVNALASVVD